MSKQVSITEKAQRLEPRDYEWTDYCDGVLGLHVRSVNDGQWKFYLVREDGCTCCQWGEKYCYHRERMMLDGGLSAIKRQLAANRPQGE